MKIKVGEDRKTEVERTIHLITRLVSFHLFLSPFFNFVIPSFSAQDIINFFFSLSLPLPLFLTLPSLFIRSIALLLAHPFEKTLSDTQNRE